MILDLEAWLSWWDADPHDTTREMGLMVLFGQMRDATAALEEMKVEWHSRAENAYHAHAWSDALDELGKIL